MPQRDPSTGRFIASGSAVLTADADQFSKGLGEATKELNSWGQNAGKELASIGSQLKKQFGGMFSGGGIAASLTGMGGVVLGTAIGGPIGTAIGSGISDGIKGASAAAKMLAVDVTETLFDQMKGLAKKGDMAAALGMTAEQFTGVAGLAKSVGEDTREFIESLVTMGKLGNDAFKGVGEVAGPAFKALKLDAAEFVALRPDQQFFKMFEALHALGPGMEQTRLLMNAFGEDGGKWLLPLLSKTPEQLRRMADGFRLNTDLIRRSQEAVQAWARVHNIGDKMLAGVAAAAAPSFTKVADVLERDFGGALKSVQPELERLSAKLGDFSADHLAPAIAGIASATKEITSMAVALADAKKAWGFDLTWAEKLANLNFPFIPKDVVPRNAIEGVHSLGLAFAALGDHVNEVNKNLNHLSKLEFSKMGGIGLIGNLLGYGPGSLRYMGQAFGTSDLAKPAPGHEPIAGYGSAFSKLIAYAGRHKAHFDKLAADELLKRFPMLGKSHPLDIIGSLGLGSHLAGLIGKWRGDEAPNPWRGLHPGEIMKELNPGFRSGGAFEQGGAGAYSLEVASRGQQFMQKQTDLAKQQLDSLKGVERKLGEIEQGIRVVGAMWDVR
ncbi:MAG: hypothetical protein U0791_02645 [Gemmataceae bacterium]